MDFEVVETSHNITPRRIKDEHLICASLRAKLPIISKFFISGTVDLYVSSVKMPVRSIVLNLTMFTILQDMRLDSDLSGTDGDYYTIFYTGLTISLILDLCNFLTFISWFISGYADVHPLRHVLPLILIKVGSLGLTRDDLIEQSSSYTLYHGDYPYRSQKSIYLEYFFDLPQAPSPMVGQGLTGQKFS